MVLELKQRAPGVDRPLANLPTAVVGKRLLLWRQDQLIELSGQQWLAFSDESATEAEVSPIRPLGINTQVSVEELLALAARCEEADELTEAADLLRAALAAGGPRAELCFQLAELLYRLGDSAAARERYYMACELDENVVEARATRGCLLAEHGQLDLAVAALEGALACHVDYADAHYHLARLLDDAGRSEDAAAHWRRYAELSPTSPCEDEAEASTSAGD
jgi:tetratricopeptide (TPR) repeat protein